MNLRFATFVTVYATVLINEFAEAQFTVFTSRQDWSFSLIGDFPEWCVDFNTNVNSDFSQGPGISTTNPVTVSDTGSVERFRLTAFGPRVDQNLISATEDTAVLFVESGSLEDRTFVDLDIIARVGEPVLAWGGDIDLGTQINEGVTLELTTTNGGVPFSIPIVSSGFIGISVQSGGSLAKVRFVATTDDTGAGGETFELDNVCGSSMIDAAPTSTPAPNMIIPTPTGGGGGDDNNCFLNFIPIIGPIWCFIFDFIGDIFNAIF